MTPEQIAADVARGIFLKAEIAKLTAELKEIENRLENAGLLGEQIPLEDSEREGRQYIARGTAKAVPVRFESDQLIAGFKPDTDIHKSIAEILGAKLPLFFKDTRVFERVKKEDANKFRQFARKNLDPDTYAKLIKACVAKTKDGIPKSKTVIGWADAKPIDQVPA